MLARARAAALERTAVLASRDLSCPIPTPNPSSAPRIGLILAAGALVGPLQVAMRALGFEPKKEAYPRLPFFVVNPYASF